MTTPHFTKLPLPEPKRVDQLPKQAQWLSGEGAGSFFLITEILEKKIFRISRFSPEGKIECEGNFKCINAENFNLEKTYFFSHLSHCKTVNIIQNSYTFTFERV